MKKWSSNIFLGLGTILVIFLVTTQYFWVKKQLELNDLRFENSIKNALGEVGKQLQIINKESVSVTYPVERIESNQFVVMINEMVNPPLLDSLISHQFRQFEIDEPYVYGIYDCHTNQVTFNQRLLPASEFSISTWDPNTHNFGLIFPELNSFTNQLKVYGLSFLIFLLVLVIVIYLVYTIFQQKKLATVKTDFVNNMTHELKTPIATIGLIGESLNKPNVLADPEKVKRYAQIVQEESRKLKHQVEKVLEVALFEADKMKMALSSFHFHTLIEEAVSDFENAPYQKTVSFKLQLNAQKDLIHADRGHLKNVLTNLIDNAIKYNDQDPVIQIETKNVGSQLHLRITDNGIGIQAEEKHHIFDKFYRIPKGNLHDVKGFGLGLFYVKSVLNMHDYSIELVPQDKGSQFLIQLNTHVEN